MFDEMLKSIQSGFTRIVTPQRLFVHHLLSIGLDVVVLF